MRDSCTGSTPSTSRAWSSENSSLMPCWGVPARTLQERSGSPCQRVIPAGLSEEEGRGKREGGRDSTDFPLLIPFLASRLPPSLFPLPASSLISKLPCY